MLNRYSTALDLSVNARALCAGGQEFESQKPAKSYAALQTVCHRFNIYTLAL